MCYDLHYQDEGVFPVALMRSPAVLFIYSIGQCLRVMFPYPKYLGMLMMFFLIVLRLG